MKRSFNHEGHFSSPSVDDRSTCSSKALAEPSPNEEVLRLSPCYARCKAAQLVHETLKEAAMTSRCVVLTAKYAYEAIAAKVGINAIGWNEEPEKIKEDWYSAARLWANAVQKADEDIRNSSKRKSRAKQRP